MFEVILYVLGVLTVLMLTSVTFIMSGEYFARKFENSKFSKWWEKNVVSHVSDEYDI